MNRILIVVILAILFISCAKNKVIDSSTSSLSFGTDETLDIITWNIEWFPKQNDRTIDYIIELIDSLNVDVIALQEIGNKDSFHGKNY